MSTPLINTPGITCWQNCQEGFNVGIAADHGGFELKEFPVEHLRAAGYEVTDFGDGQLK
jgi:hypothetical protein